MWMCAGGAHRTRKVRHDADLVRVAHRHDLEHLGHAADVRQRRAREVDVAIFDERVELPTLTPLLAWRERHARQQSKLRESASGSALLAPDPRRSTGGTARSGGRSRRSRGSRTSGECRSPSCRPDRSLHESVRRPSRSTGCARASRTSGRRVLRHHRGRRPPGRSPHRAGPRLPPPAPDRLPERRRRIPDSAECFHRRGTRSSPTPSSPPLAP